MLLDFRSKWRERKLNERNEANRKRHEENELWHAISERVSSQKLYERGSDNPIARFKRPAAKWVRNEGCFKRWRRVDEPIGSLVESPQYPSDADIIRAEIPEFSEEDFDRLELAEYGWTYERTSYLIEMCTLYHLRFGLVAGNWDIELYGPISLFDVKDQYYRVKAAVEKDRDPDAKIYVFDRVSELKRREQLEKLHGRSEREVKEEIELLAQLKLIQERWTRGDDRALPAINDPTNQIAQIQRLLRTNCSIDDQLPTSTHISSTFFNDLREKTRQPTLLTQLLDALKRFDPLRLKECSFVMSVHLLKLTILLNQIHDTTTDAHELSLTIARKIKQLENMGGQFPCKKQNIPPLLTDATKLLKTQTPKK